MRGAPFVSWRSQESQPYGPGRLSGNPPPRWGAPGDDKAAGAASAGRLSAQVGSRVMPPRTPHGLLRFRSDTVASQPPDGFNPATRAVRIGPLALDSGDVLPDVVMTYQSWGNLATDATNAVLVEHALTGDSHVVGDAGPGQPTAGWWPDLIGTRAPLDTNRFYALAINVLGGCRGSTGPASLAPDGRPWGSRFPQITVRDQVRAEAAVADALGIENFHAVIGGSMGGMRALEWVASYPDRVERALAVATAGRATADQIGWGHTQILAITTDPDFRGGDYLAHGVRPDRGLSLARQIAHASYRSASEFETRFGTDPQPGEQPLAGGRFSVEGYLDHHGRKLCQRFDALSYVRLTQAMATHDIGRGRGGFERVLQDYPGELLVAAVDSDRLFPVGASAAVVRGYGRGRLRMIHSPYGHDGFLIEADQVAALVRELVDRPVARIGRRVRGVA